MNISTRRSPANAPRMELPSTTTRPTAADVGGPCHSQRTAGERDRTVGSIFYLPLGLKANGLRLYGRQGYGLLLVL